MSYPIMSVDVPWSLVKSGFKKTPRFNTNVQTPAARRGITAVSYMPFPTWDFEVDLNYVRGGESVQWSVLQKFLGCFVAARGRGNPFYFTDPNDNGVSDDGILLNVTPGAATPMGTIGDSVSTQFQLARRIDQGVDIIQNITTNLVSLNGEPTGAGSTSSTGVVTFNTPPASGVKLSWQGRFRYLCRFSEDTVQDLARVSATTNRDGLTEFLWSASSISFQSEFLK